MCFGNKLKGDDDPAARMNNDDYLNPRPVDSKPAKHASASMPQNDSYAPPAGPPSHQYQSPEIYSSPSGPPPSHNNNNQQSDTYAPPSGPPPSHDYYAPPPGPPPAQEPYHDWQTAVPDTSLLPPPPVIGNFRSNANNATEEEADQGEEWCASNPMYGPISLSPQSQHALESGEIGVVIPRTYKGELMRLRPGVWKGKTKRDCPDCCIMSTVPLYSVYTYSPLQTNRTKTIYYEVRIPKTNPSEVTLALGFTAPPYPTFRCPGWHRGSLAVHGDDGNRYVNDRWGGKDFMQPFQPGQTIGIGMTFTRTDLNAPPPYNDGRPERISPQTPIDVEVFITNNGRKIGYWYLHEEGDAEQDLPVTGLEGFNDLMASVGAFKDVEFEIVFNEGEWMYRP
jgi:hypothetical protein